MNIVKHTYSFASGLVKRKSTKKIVLHHAAAKTCSVNDIHSWHLANGWAGIGYHFLVRKDGSVHEGRPIEMIGAHASSTNGDSIGICFEGNFEIEQMSAAQKEAGAELVTHLKKLYPSIETVGKHKDYGSTACPGKYFPFNYIAKGAEGDETKTEVKEDEELVEIKAGQHLSLKNEPLYVSSTIKTRAGTVNGTYYAWSSEVINGRIKITNAKTKAGIKGQVTGWIDAPKLDYVIYTVKAGDTLSKIAKAYKTTIKKIAEDNNIENVNLIIVGQELKITK